MYEKSNSKKFSSSALGTNTEALYWWLFENPVDGLTPMESQLNLVVLLWAIHAPHDLRQFLSLTELLPEILSNMTELCTSSNSVFLRKNGIYIQNLKRLSIHLHENEEELIKLLGDEIQSIESNGSSPMRGKLKSYYVYAAMMSTSESRDIDEDQMLIQLKSALVLCHMLLILDEFLPQDFLIYPSENSYQINKQLARNTALACRFIRQSSLTKNSIFIENIESFGSLRELHSALQKQQQLETEAYKKLYGMINNIFSPTLESKKSNGWGKSSNAWKLRGWADGFVRGRDGQIKERIEEDDKFVEIVNASKVGDEEIEAGLAEGDNSVEDELILVNDENIKSKNIFSKHQIKHIEMSNQHLNFEWSRNTIQEISDSLRLFINIIQNSENKLEMETACLSLIMISTGESLENIINRFRYVDLNTKTFHKSISYIWDGQNNEGSWMIYPTLPNQQLVLSSDQQKLCDVKSRGMSLNLPDCLDVGSYIRKIFDEKTLKDLDNKKIFKHKTSVYRACLNKIIKASNIDSRVNEHRIRSHLFNIIISELTGDIAEATLMTGRYHPLARTRLHYSAFPVSYLQNLYVDAMQSLIRDVSKNGFEVPRSIAIKNQVEVDEVIGSDYSPKIASIQKAIECTLKTLSVKPKSNFSHDVIEYHNLYTLYTVLFTGYCTGYRAVLDPFPSNIDIDPDDGLCLISDKDGSDYYNSRVVWLPNVLIKQLNLYREHRKIMMSFLVGNNANRELLDALPNLFFVDSKFNIQNVRPSTLEPLLESILPLPINSNRRFLRSKLRLRGCPPEIVDAFMGHWSRGEEPWGRYSTLSYHLIVKDLKKYLEPLVIDLGLKPIGSRIYVR